MLRFIVETLSFDNHIQQTYRTILYSTEKSLFVFQSVSMEEDTRYILLHIVAGGSAMRRFISRACSIHYISVSLQNLSNNLNKE